jgi:hypothetical protein
VTPEKGRAAAAQRIPAVVQAGFTFLAATRDEERIMGPKEPKSAGGDAEQRPQSAKANLSSLDEFE